MIRNLIRAVVATLLLAVVTGLIYPLVMTGFAQVVFHGKAEGSIVRVGGRDVGSRLIGQQWDGPKWFYGRPSANNYGASTSGGSNLGPTSQSLADRIRARSKAIIATEGPYSPGLTTDRIPVDLLTASASGLDPDISPAAAEFQASRIASVRHLSLDFVRSLIRGHTQRVPLDLFGAPHVNVFELNLALSKMQAR